jgi:hypothetical protein
MKLLSLAAAQLRSSPNDLFMSPVFDKTHDLAAFIEQSAARLLSGDVTAGDGLLMVFLPTSDWDDAGGSQDIANRACEFLEPYLIPSPKAQSRTIAEPDAPPNGGPRWWLAIRALWRGRHR